MAALCSAALVAYVQRNSIGVAEETIRRELNLSKHQMGWVISCFFLSYAAFQLPTGYLGQIWGTRRALSIFATLFSAAAGVFALAFGPWSLMATRLGMGGLQAGIFPCAVNTVSKWLPDTRRSFSTGMLGSFMSIGGAVGAALTGLLLPLVGWRISYLIYSVPGLIFAFAFYIWFRDRPEEHRSVNQDELDLISGDDSPSDSDIVAERSASEPDSEPTPWRAIFTSGPVLALCAQQVFRAAGYMFFASWFATYLRETREVDDWVVGILTSLPLWAVVIGSPTGGIIADCVLARTGNRRLSRQGVAATAMLACAILVFIAYPIANPWIAVALISIGSFFAAFAGPCAYTSTIDMGGRHVPMVFSTMNMAGNFGAFLFPIVVPWLLSESELYVDKIKLTSAGVNSGPVVKMLIEAEQFDSGDTKLAHKFGENDETVARFHHGTRQTRIIFTQYDIEVPETGEYGIMIHHAGARSPKLRLTVNGRETFNDTVSRTDGQRDADVLTWSPTKSIELSAGKNVLRLETESEASGNWDLVLFMFGGMYIAACVCWLFVNTNITISGPNE